MKNLKQIGAGNEMHRWGGQKYTTLISAEDPIRGVFPDIVWDHAVVNAAVIACQQGFQDPKSDCGKFACQRTLLRGFFRLQGYQDRV